MKKKLIAFTFLACGLGNAIAACSGTYLTQAALNTLIAGKTACSPAACSGTGGTCEWQETHQGSLTGTLVEQHTGKPGDPVETVGSWAIASNGKITHSYSGGGGNNTYDVNDNGNGTYSFCNGPGASASGITFSVKPGRC
jgi:hypothetical protein